MRAGLVFNMSAKIIIPKRFSDSRGWFTESWNARTFSGLGISTAFCQDNHSLSKPAFTLRGLHFQRAPHAQAKLVRCLRGRIYDVAVDIRRDSPTYKHWVGVELSAELGNQLFVPSGYAHGFLTLEPDCEVAYKVDAYYAPESDGGICWDDPELAILWPLECALPHLSDKDATLPLLSEANFDFAYDGNPLLPMNS
jgi:dTDP-4-dehydrorhamnose 3,5-epimerase